MAVSRWSSRCLFILFGFFGSSACWLGCGPGVDSHVTDQSCKLEYAPRNFRELYNACRTGVQLAAQMPISDINLELVEITDHGTDGKSRIRTVRGFSSEALSSFYEKTANHCFSRFNNREASDACRFGAVQYANEIRAYLIRNRFIECLVLDVRRQIGQMPFTVVKARAQLKAPEPGEFCILHKDLIDSSEPSSRESN